MTQSSSTVSGIADTARWVAYFRAQESRRPDALFRDPYAERLAGERGFEIANALPDGTKHEWAWVTRTCLFDRFVLSEIEQGGDMIVNVAAGLDARPYRMDLPSALQWIEVDLAEIISHKEEILAKENPKCRLERICLDLSDVRARRALFSELDCRARKVVIITEGLLLYFTAEQVASLARDLADKAHFQSWITDLVSPGQLKLMQRATGKPISEAGAPFQFGPPERPNFFVPYGWVPKDVQGLLSTAAQLKRAPVELLSLLPEPRLRSPNYPWTGVCLLRKL